MSRDHAAAQTWENPLEITYHEHNKTHKSFPRDTFRRKTYIQSFECS